MSATVSSQHQGNQFQKFSYKSSDSSKEVSTSSSDDSTSLSSDKKDKVAYYLAHQIDSIGVTQITYQLQKEMAEKSKRTVEEVRDELLKAERHYAPGSFVQVEPPPNQRGEYDKYIALRNAAAEKYLNGLKVVLSNLGVSPTKKLSSKKRVAVLSKVVGSNLDDEVKNMDPRLKNAFSWYVKLFRMGLSTKKGKYRECKKLASMVKKVEKIDTKKDPCFHKSRMILAVALTAAGSFCDAGRHKFLPFFPFKP